MRAYRGAITLLLVCAAIASSFAGAATIRVVNKAPFAIKTMASPLQSNNRWQGISNAIWERFSSNDMPGEEVVLEQDKDYVFVIDDSPFAQLKFEAQINGLSLAMAGEIGQELSGGSMKTISYALGSSLPAVTMVGFPLGLYVPGVVLLGGVGFVCFKYFRDSTSTKGIVLETGKLGSSKEILVTLTNRNLRSFVATMKVSALSKASQTALVKKKKKDDDKARQKAEDESLASEEEASAKEASVEEASEQSPVQQATPVSPNAPAAEKTEESKTQEPLVGAP